ncbi:hypothetical protein EIN_179670 [Entamoeba invadens IP1]|uniref:hypothetical protein n=1 Tax=Entamoeba invadens IP1 TaxID=370355 RepID=UPI0002C3D20F|nr:hypothetical protein EIN_179670 [Entamoeba invadens IP1]ELP93940.1 hypothetical protein EIN_179670 [Entamoeba invadens IP1]|eukprot:XP_004260711.1 hypothetical protein EIN_179670 [Entamoeba invadens IP1]
MQHTLLRKGKNISSLPYKKVNVSFIQRINTVTIEKEKFELYRLNSKFEIQRTKNVGDELYIDVDVDPDQQPFVSTLVRFLNGARCWENSIYQLPIVISRLALFGIPIPDILNWAGIDVTTQQGEMKFDQILYNSLPRELEIILRGNLNSQTYPDINIENILKTFCTQDFRGKEAHKAILDTFFNKSKEDLISMFISNSKIDIIEVSQNQEFTNKREMVVFALVEKVVESGARVAPEQVEVIKASSSLQFVFDEEYLIHIICTTKRDLSGNSITPDRIKKALQFLDTSEDKETIIQKAINDGVLDEAYYDYPEFKEFELDEMTKVLIQKDCDNFQYAFRKMGENVLLSTNECGLITIHVETKEYVIVKNSDSLIVYSETGDSKLIDGIFSFYGGDNPAIYLNGAETEFCEELADIIGVGKTGDIKSCSYIGQVL